MAFDAATQLAEVQICIDRIFSSSLDISENATREPIKNIPVHVAQGGGWSHTFPFKAGEPCQVSFSQAGYDHWLWEDKDLAGTLDGAPKPWLRRQFSEDDGFCLIGYNTVPRAITSYSDAHSEWRNADATQIIKLKDDGDIEIESTTKVLITAPETEVQCTNALVNATTKAEVTTAEAAITATTKATITTPLLDLICATQITATTALLALSGSLTVGGTVVAVGEVTGNGKLLSTHEHAGDGGTGSGASTGPPT